MAIQSSSISTSDSFALYRFFDASTHGARISDALSAPAFGTNFWVRPVLVVAAVQIAF